MADCIVIGGGVIGLMTALELRRAGLSVILLERGELGQESSWAGGGILSPLQPWAEVPALNQLVAWGRRQYPRLINDIRQHTGIDPEFFNCGMLFTGLTNNSMKLATQWAQQEDVMLKPTNLDALSLLEPQMRANGKDKALLLPDISTVRNPRLLRALRQYVMQHDVDVQCQTEAQLLFNHEAKKVSVHTLKKTLQADHIIVAGGAWSGQLLQDDKIDVNPVKGQMLLFRAEKTLLNHVVVDEGGYLIPRRDGRILVGSTVEFCGFNKNTTTSAAIELKRRAASLLPALKNIPIEKHWAGLRPGTRRKTPYICRHPKYNNLYINTGHFRNGFSLAPGSARLLTDLVLQRKPIMDAAPFAIHSVL